MELPEIVHDETLSPRLSELCSSLLNATQTHIAWCMSAGATETKAWGELSIVWETVLEMKCTDLAEAASPNIVSVGTSLSSFLGTGKSFDKEAALAEDMSIERVAKEVRALGNMTVTEDVDGALADAGFDGPSIKCFRETATSFQCSTRGKALMLKTMAHIQPLADKVLEDCFGRLASQGFDSSDDHPSSPVAPPQLGLSHFLPIYGVRYIL